MGASAKRDVGKTANDELRRKAQEYRRRGRDESESRDEETTKESKAIKAVPVRPQEAFNTEVNLERYPRDRVKGPDKTVPDG